MNEHIETLRMMRRDATLLPYHTALTWALSILDPAKANYYAKVLMYIANDESYLPPDFVSNPQRNACRAGAAALMRVAELDADNARPQ